MILLSRNPRSPILPAEKLFSGSVTSQNKCRRNLPHSCPRFWRCWPHHIWDSTEPMKLHAKQFLGYQLSGSKYIFNEIQQQSGIYWLRTISFKYSLEGGTANILLHSISLDGMNQRLLVISYKKWMSLSFSIQCPLLVSPSFMPSLIQARETFECIMTVGREGSLIQHDNPPPLSLEQELRSMVGRTQPVQTLVGFH